MLAKLRYHKSRAKNGIGAGTKRSTLASNTISKKPNVHCPAVPLTFVEPWVEGEYGIVNGEFVDG